MTAVVVTTSLIVAFAAGWALGAVFVAACVAEVWRRKPQPFRPDSYWG